MRIRMPSDYKNPIGFTFWNIVNQLVIRFYFRSVGIQGLSNLPAEPFILIANHSSRWDGPLVQFLLNRRANFMVSPNEIKGLQRPAVLSVGAFPANPRLDLVNYCRGQLSKGEPVVIFPEGNVFYDGELHPFKKGTARIALSAAEGGLECPIVPVFIAYDFSGNGRPTARITIGEQIAAREFSANAEDKDAVKSLTDRLRHSVEAIRSRSSKVLSLEAKERSLDAAV